MAGGCSKASGLTRLLEYLSIPADCVMAVGDHTNDIELIKKAGIGVAVANADSQLKAAADYVTAGERDLGVKEAIEKLCLVSEGEAKKNIKITHWESTGIPLTDFYD